MSVVFIVNINIYGDQSFVDELKRKQISLSFKVIKKETSNVKTSIL